jgi:hypothetical protein
MTRKAGANTYVARVIDLSFRSMVVLLSICALAEVNTAHRSSGNFSLAAQHGARTPWRELPRPLLHGISVVHPEMTRNIRRAVNSPSTIDFLPPAIYSSGGLIATSVAVADLNGDRKPDLVVANCSPTGSPNCAGEGSVGVFLGNGDGTFQPVATYDSGGGNAESVAVADVNGDDKPDLLVANEGSSTVGLLLGNGDGTFQSAIIYGSGGNYPVSVAVADVNGDGKPDLVVANLCDIDCSSVNGGVAGVLLGNGDGTFQPAVPYNDGQSDLESAVVADVNADGKPDLVLAKDCFDNTCANGGVGVLLGNGNGTFQQGVNYSSGGAFPISVAVADVNGDGKPDLLVANCDASGSSGCIDVSVDGSVGVLLGNGDGSFQAAVAYDSGGSGAWSVAVADMNGDGKPDVLVANQCGSGCSSPGAVGVLLGKGQGIFANPVNLPPDFNTSVAAADVNGDGKPDLLVATNDATGMGAVGVLLNNTAIAPRITKTVVSTSGSPSLVGQSVTFTAMVTSTHGAIPDGEVVTFYDGMTALATVTLSGGGAAFTTSSLTAKAHTIKVIYAGDPTFLPSAGRVKQVVEKYPTNTILTSRPNPSQFGQPVTFRARVKSTGPAPTGKVMFMDGTTGIGSASLNGRGVAILIKSKLAIGTHSITAHYVGDAASAKSTSSVVIQKVQ